MKNFIIFFLSFSNSHILVDLCDIFLPFDSSVLNNTKIQQSSIEIQRIIPQDPIKYTELTWSVNIDNEKQTPVFTLKVPVVKLFRNLSVLSCKRKIDCYKVFSFFLRYLQDILKKRNSILYKKIDLILLKEEIGLLIYKMNISCGAARDLEHLGIPVEEINKFLEIIEKYKTNTLGPYQYVDNPPEEEENSHKYYHDICGKYQEIEKAITDLKIEENEYNLLLDNLLLILDPHDNYTNNKKLVETVIAREREEISQEQSFNSMISNRITFPIVDMSRKKTSDKSIQEDIIEQKLIEKKRKNAYENLSFFLDSNFLVKLSSLKKVNYDFEIKNPATGKSQISLVNLVEKISHLKSKTKNERVNTIARIVDILREKYFMCLWLTYYKNKLENSKSPTEIATKILKYQIKIAKLNIELSQKHIELYYSLVRYKKRPPSAVVEITYGNSEFSHYL